MAHNDEGEAQRNAHPEQTEDRAPTVVWKTTGGKGGLTFVTKDNPKLIIHTTETQGLPSYPYPPHLTINLREPETIWQHVSLDRGAYAMKSASPESPNYEAGATYQIEHIAYAADTPHWSDAEYHSLAREVLWFNKNKKVPLNFAPVWEDGSAYGDWSGRMSQAEFKAFSGVCGHQHAPSPNAHWDPGKLDVAKLKRFIDDLREEGDDDLAHITVENQKWLNEMVEALRDKNEMDDPNKEGRPPSPRLFAKLGSVWRHWVDKTSTSEPQQIAAKTLAK
jgi:hypothetical protein